MAKIIKPADKFKPIKCEVCGCVYEHEEGDRIEATLVKVLGAKDFILERKLKCPVCQNENELKGEGE